MNRFFKKTLSLMLVIVMTVSLGVSAAAADQTGAAQAEGPLGIVSAMSVELNALVEATKISKTEEIAGNTFYEGVLNGVDVVLVKAGIGKVLAASCAETLIDTYHVGGIVFTGIAGGVGDDVNVMDMVIATELVQHDYGTETNSGFEWNGKAGSNQETGMIPVDESLSKIAYDSACTVLGAEKVHQGVIATGDQFISSESYVKELQTKFNALACEMEGASVARVADEFHVPCAILRCMSDKADGIAHDTYAFNYTEASNTSASVVKEMLNTIAKDRVALPAAKDVAAKDTTPRTAIISAMSVELKALVDAADIQKETVIGSKTYYVGKLNGEDVVLVQAGVGKVLSANYTAALLNNFTVKGVVFTGIAGGVGDDVNMPQVLAQYFRESTEPLLQLGPVSVTAWQLLLFALLVGAVSVVACLRRGTAAQLVPPCIVWGLGLAAPASWMVLSKAHAAIHTHLVPMLWHFAFVPISCMLLPVLAKLMIPGRKKDLVASH